MKREYTVRGNVIEVEELEQIVAVMPTARDEARAQLVRAFGQKPKAPEIELEKEDWDAFESAGWVFVRPSADVRGAVEAGASVEGTEAVQRVFRLSDGRLALGTDRLSVRLRDDMTEQEAESALDTYSLEVANRLTFAPNLFEVRVPPGTDFLDASSRLTQQDDVIYAEPQFIEHIPQRFTPSDPDYGDQWHLNNTGQDGGTAGADISAEDAWDTTRGAGLRVAVIDNGFDVDHDDLAAAVAPTSGFFETNAMGNTVFVQGVPANYPDGNHGTFCAGMVVARASNGENGCGVANLADWIAVACLGDQTGTQATLARAVAYAADPTEEVGTADPDDGADVISCSLGPNNAPWTMMQVLQDAIDFAVTNGRGGRGTPIFWATDNANVPVAQDQVVSYANTIAVGRSTRDDLEDNSAFGPELCFLATGVDVSSTTSGGGFGTSTGTSFAAPTAAGVGALVLAVDPDLAWDEVRDIIRETCDKIGGVVYDANGHNDDYGFGRVNAARAVCRAAQDVTLLSPSVAFSDVPEGETTARAVVFSVVRCGSATFQIVAGPSVTSGPGSFGTLPSPNAVLPAVTIPEVREARLWLSFTGTSDGDVTAGEVTVRLVETGEEWVVPISANTIARPTVVVALALDQSGSMLWASGLPSLPTRNDVLKFAAPVFVNVLQEDNGIGIVAFDHDAYVRMAVQTAGPAGPIDPARATALGVIQAHTPNPAGNTAIGDAVEAASGLVAAVTGFDQEALVVFTDGHETAAKYLSEVAPLINERVFAIGLGTAEQIQPTALTALTNGTGGYLLLTGAIGPDDLFRLGKYYLQILAGVTNQDIVLDPQGALQPGQQHRIPFTLNEADVGVDAILMAQTDLPGIFEWGLETPAGDVIDPTAAVPIPGVDFIAAQGASFYRMTLPVPIGAGARAGTWHAVLTVDKRIYKRYLSFLFDVDPKLAQQVHAHGVRYSLSVQSFSGLRLQAQLLQDSQEPGATLTVRAVLTEYGLPIESDRAHVRAEFNRPDTTGGTLTLAETDPGIYSATTLAALAGVYPFRVLADGSTLRGRPFTREHLLTGAVWKGGNEPPPHDDDDHEDLCRLLACLTSERVITPDLHRRLADLGLDLKTLRRCVRAWCRQPQRDSLSTIEAPNAVWPAQQASGAEPSPAMTLTPYAAELIRQLAGELWEDD